MVIGWIITLALIEWYSIGITVLAYRKKEKLFLLNLIPFVSFFYIDKLVKGFTILVVPTKKWGLTSIILLVAALISTGLTYLGNAHFGAENAMYIQQIMLVPIVICLLLLYLGIVCSSLELYRMIEIKMPNYARVLSALFILPIPLALIIRGK